MISCVATFFDAGILYNRLIASLLWVDQSVLLLFLKTVQHNLHLHSTGLLGFYLISMNQKNERKYDFKKIY